MTIEKLHDILFDMLCAIDDACRKEGVSWSLGGGTMLGAVRHHDFIPWDDDADICLWRGDYPDETTVKVAKESGFEARNGEIRRMV